MDIIETIIPLIIILAVGITIFVLRAKNYLNFYSPKSKIIRSIGILVLLACLLYDANVDYNPSKLKSLSYIICILLVSQVIEHIKEYRKSKV